MELSRSNLLLMKYMWYMGIHQGWMCRDIWLSALLYRMTGFTLPVTSYWRTRVSSIMQFTPENALKLCHRSFFLFQRYPMHKAASDNRMTDQSELVNSSSDWPYLISFECIEYRAFIRLLTCAHKCTVDALYIKWTWTFWTGTCWIYLRYLFTWIHPLCVAQRYRVIIIIIYF